MWEAHVKHGVLDMLARVHEVADDAHGLIVDANVVAAQHLYEGGQRLTFHDEVFVLLIFKSKSAERPGSSPLHLRVSKCEQV